MQTMRAKDFHLNAAGRAWLIPEVELTAIPGGWGISQAEIDRVHRAIAANICTYQSVHGVFNQKDLVFLLDTACMTLGQLEDSLNVPRGNLSKWLMSHNMMPPGESWRLRLHILQKLFPSLGPGQTESHIEGAFSAMKAQCWLIKKGETFDVTEVRPDTPPTFPAAPPPTLQEHLAKSAAWGRLKRILEEAGRGEIPVSGETLLDLLEEVEEGK